MVTDRRSSLDPIASVVPLAAPLSRVLPSAHLVPHLAQLLDLLSLVAVQPLVMILAPISTADQMPTAYFEASVLFALAVLVMRVTLTLDVVAQSVSKTTSAPPTRSATTTAVSIHARRLAVSILNVPFAITSLSANAPKDSPAIHSCPAPHHPVPTWPAVKLVEITVPPLRAEPTPGVASRTTGPSALARMDLWAIPLRDVAVNAKPIPNAMPTGLA